MNYLDCHTRKSTISSLCELFSCSAKDLISFLENTEIETDNYPPDRDIYYKTVKHFGASKTPDYVCWFHATRTYQGNDFSEGILPLGEVLLESLWVTLFTIFKDTKHYSHLLKMKHESNVSSIYKRRISPCSGGPFAHLIREAIFKTEESWSGDYLKLPEIIKHICDAYYSKYKSQIYDVVERKLKPCIVKFKDNNGNHRGYFEAAIFYLYCCNKGERLTDFANICFDGGGIPIPQEDIIDIEFDPIFTPF